MIKSDDVDDKPGQGARKLELLLAPYLIHARERFDVDVDIVYVCLAV